MEKNSDIRNEARKAGVKLWQIAERLNITDSTFSRKLRRELTVDEKAAIIAIINEIRGGAANVS